MVKKDIYGPPFIPSSELPWERTLTANPAGIFDVTYASSPRLTAYRCFSGTPLGKRTSMGTRSSMGRNVIYGEECHLWEKRHLWGETSSMAAAPAPRHFANRMIGRLPAMAATRWDIRAASAALGQATPPAIHT
jgi:hypothetical protein